MFFDIGPLELIALVILAVLVFGPEKLPKVIQDVSRFIRKVREFSDNAKEDIRSELGPEFKDFEFEDLNPKNFVRKHVLDSDEMGLKEIRNGFDLRKEMAEVADAVNGRESDAGHGSSGSSPTSKSGGGSGSDGGSSTPDLLRKREEPGREERPPFDSDAT
ncbi:sec-independent translocase [Streptomyces bingchenggensis BCW-1]|uniref:Sec-independent protein translocase protein TatB n=1 Tax=Streptomyces bingchenggensis (strain BCW-1) TaxID=749414 RepID=D7BQH1_STRBB|nr:MULTISPECIES: sec-independent translocase [Streptomyces]ADI07200.1 sec-independent translocase [Streptomyces bingchenggensis BCW-1]